MSGHRVIGQLPAANGDVTFSRAELYLEGSQRCCRVITVREKHDLEWRCARVNLARFDFRSIYRFERGRFEKAFAARTRTNNDASRFYTNTFFGENVSVLC